MRKTAVIIIIAGILGLAVIAIPGHLCAASGHDGCEVCHFFHHPPILQIGITETINPFLLRERLAKQFMQEMLAEHIQTSCLSRAPPAVPLISVSL